MYYRGRALVYEAAGARHLAEWCRVTAERLGRTKTTQSEPQVRKGKRV